MPPAPAPAPNPGPDPKSVLCYAFTRQLRRLIKCGMQSLWTATPDSMPLVANIGAVARSMSKDSSKFEVIHWDCDAGWMGEANTINMKSVVENLVKAMKWTDSDPQIKDPVNVLKAIPLFEGFNDAVVVLWNFDVFFPNPEVRQVFENLSKTNKLNSEGACARPVYFIGTPGTEPHAAVAHHVHVVEFNLPTIDEIREGPVKFIVESVRKPGAEAAPEQLVEDIAKACCGLNRNQIVNVLSYSATANGGIKTTILTDIRRQKAKLLAKSRVLEVLSDAELTPPSDLSGMEVLMRDVSLSALSYTDDAKHAGLDLPSGVVLVGMPGSGKSRMATAIAHVFRTVAHREFPVVRVDVGAIFGSLLGQSEKNWREARDALDAQNGCVAFFDELDKTFGGLNGVQGDSGVSMRVFGDVLTWLADRSLKGSETYAVVTMNDPTNIRPEFFRRFDEKYFVDLPDALTREEIFKIHLRKRLARAQPPLALDDLKFEGTEWALLAEASDEFVGHEIERAVASAQRKRFVRDKSPLPTYADLASAVGDMKSSILMATQRPKLDNLKEACKNYKIVHDVTPLFEQIRRRRINTRDN